MSYSRVTESGHYIWPDEDGIHFDFNFVSNDEIDILLYKLYTNRNKEFQERLQHGKNIVQDWENKNYD